MSLHRPNLIRIQLSAKFYARLMINGQWAQRRGVGNLMSHLSHDIHIYTYN